MPVAVKKTTPDYHDDTITWSQPRPTRRHVATQVAPSPRWKEAPASPRRAPKPSPRRSARTASESHDVQELLTHFGHGNAEREAKERELWQEKRHVRRRTRLRHRPLHLSAFCAVVVGTPLGLLACLLVIQSNAQTLLRKDADLKDQISESRFTIERTRKEIAALGASPQLANWARERQWRVATLQDFDQVPSTPSASASTASQVE